MRPGRLPTSLLLLLLSTASTTLANQVLDSHDTSPLVGRSVEIPESPADVAAKRNPSKYQKAPRPRSPDKAPVDGNDGRPHAGPFVETTAERDRKKTKGSSDKGDASDTQNESPEQLATDGMTVPNPGGGVMDDPNRTGPKEGTRGTEGGVSEKSSGSYIGTEKTPDSPKEAPPLPHSEQEKIPGKKGSKSDKESQDEVLQKPEDLPESPHSDQQAASEEVDDDLSPDSMSKSPSSSPSHVGPHVDATGNEIIQPFHSLVLSFTMILFSEIGDKTFLVAALMAMRHPRMVVFSAAFAALITMTVLSAVLGHAVPTLISPAYTNFLAAILFLVFGVKMLLEARAMSPDESVSEEMKEVEMELEEKEHQQRVGRRRSSVTPHSLESGRGMGARKGRSSSHRLPSPESVSSSSSRESSPSRTSTFTNAAAGINNLCALLLSPAWVQTFVMTFLGEWGDRSQIATIAMAAGQDYWWVTGGAITGHGVCTAAAVIGGRAVAGKVSMRVVTFGGAVAFFIFGLLYLFEAVY